MTSLEHCSFLGGVAFREAGLLGTVLVVLGLLLQGTDHCSGTFLFCNSSSFSGLCASVWPLGKHVVAEAVYNWYLRDINIYSLSKKKAHQL